MTSPGISVVGGLLRGAQYTWRGWILAGFLLILAWMRWHSDRELLPLWLLLSLAGSLWRVYAGRYIDSHSNSLRLAGNSLAVAGPYRIGRHPLYLANILAGTGLVLYSNCLPVWAAGFMIIFLAAHHAGLATTEERFMTKTWGPSYQSYLMKTSRWIGIPKTLPRHEVAEGSGIPIPGVWRRQGPNVVKTAAAAVLLWALANSHSW